MKDERSEMLETMRNAMPKEVGGILRRMVGANEAAERMKRVKFRQQRRRVVKEHAFLSLEEAIFGVGFLRILSKFDGLKRVKNFKFIGM